MTEKIKNLETITIDADKDDDPIVKDDCVDTIERTDAIEQLSSAHLNLMPVYLENGIIKSSIGAYRLARNDDGKTALLFAFDAEDLEGDNPVADKQLYVVDAKANNTKRPWIDSAISKHQEELYDLYLEHATLYQTDKYTWKNTSVAYKIFPINEEDQIEGQDRKFKLRFYSNTEEVEKFTAVDEESPEGFFANVFSPGEDVGDFTRRTAKQFIANDFMKRLKRMESGQDPVTIKEMSTQPKVPILRAIQKSSKYLKETQIVRIGADAVKLLTTAADFTSWPNAALEKLGNKLSEAKKRKEDITTPLRKHENTEKLWWSEVCQEANMDQIKDFKYLDAKQAKIAPDDARILKSLDHTQPQKYILGALQGRSGMIAYPRPDGIINIQQPNGLHIYYINKEKEDGSTIKKAFARYRENWALEGATPLPETVKELFKNNEMIEIDLSFGRITSKEISQAEFRQNLIDLTKNENWGDKKHDDFYSKFYTPKPPIESDKAKLESIRSASLT